MHLSRSTDFQWLAECADEILPVARFRDAEFLNPRKFYRAAKSLRDLRREHFDLAVEFKTGAESEARAQAVAASGAKILVVAMGVPRQEYFIEEYWDRLGVSFAIGVGGSFDVLAGLRKRAPEIVQRVGMEWAFRLVQEPRRLWKRYLVTNARFLSLISRELVSSLKQR